MRARGFLRAVSVVLLAAIAAAQEPPATTLPDAILTPTPTPEAADSEYRVGAGDVLDVNVFGNPDLSRSAPVQTNGTIVLPLLGEVPVATLTVPEVQRKLTTLLARDFLVDPQVEVRVKEYNSQFVFVVGEVNGPGRKPLRGKTRLIDILVDAGGFTPRASGIVEIARSTGTFEGEQKTLRMQLGGGTLSVQDQINLEVALRNGDIITALQKQFVTVEGEVSRPGRYALEADLTVSGAISQAGGLTRFGSSKVKVRRIDPQTGSTEILEVDLKDVRKGKEDDLKLQPNDVVTVSRKFF